MLGEDRCGRAEEQDAYRRARLVLSEILNWMQHKWRDLPMFLNSCQDYPYRFGNFR